MAEQIATGAVVLSADSTKLEQGLNNAQNKITGWANGLQKNLNSALPTNSFVGIQSAFQGLSGGLMGAGKALMANPWVAAAAVGVAAGVKLYNVVSDNISAAWQLVAAQEELADAFNTSSEEAGQLGYFANKTGTSIETIKKASITLSEQIDSALSGDPKARDALASLGIVASENLKKAGLYGQLKEISKQLEQLPDPTSRMAAMQKIFGGKISWQLLKTFADGSEELERLESNYQRFNLAVRSTDASKLEEADKSWDTMGDSWQGLWQSFWVPLTMSFASVKTVISSVFTEVFVLIKNITKPFTAWFSALFSGIGATVQVVWEYLKPLVQNLTNIGNDIQWVEFFEKGFLQVARTVGSVIGWLLNAFSKVGLFIYDYFVSPIINGFATVLQFLQPILDKMAKIESSLGINLGASALAGGLANVDIDAFKQTIAEARGAIGNVDFQAGVTEFFDKVEAKLKQIKKDADELKGQEVLRGGMELLSDLEASNKKLQTQVQYWDSSAEQIKRNELAAKGLNAEVLAQLDQQLAKQKELNELVELQKELKKLQEASVSPLEKYEKKMDTIKKALALPKELGGIDAGQADQLMAAAVQEMGKGLKLDAIKLPQLQIEGSKEATETVIKAQLQAQRTQESPQQQMVKQLDRQRLVQERQLETARELNDFLKNNKQQLAVI